MAPPEEITSVLRLTDCGGWDWSCWVEWFHSELKPGDIVALLGFSAVLAGWLVTHYLEARLQKRQLAFELINTLFHTPSHLTAARGSETKIVAEVEDSNNARETEEEMRGRVVDMTYDRSLRDKRTKKERRLFQNMSTVLGNFEFIAIAAQESTADEKILFAYLAGDLIRTYCVNAMAIKRMRHWDRNNEVCAYLERLAKKWAKRHSSPEIREIANAHGLIRRPWWKILG